jgi:hypothetical protein
VREREYLRVGIDEAPGRMAEGWVLVTGWFPFATSWWAWFAREADAASREAGR